MRSQTSPSQPAQTWTMNWKVTSLFLHFPSARWKRRPKLAILIVLADARWYTREEILGVLGDPLGTKLKGNDPTKGGASTAASLAGDAAKSAGGNDAQAKPDEPPFRLPPITAIAGVLISDWAHKKVIITGPEAPREVRGNL